MIQLTKLIIIYLKKKFKKEEQSSVLTFKKMKLNFMIKIKK